jgi:cell wall-associated NlpC family hydrolase
MSDLAPVAFPVPAGVADMQATFSALFPSPALSVGGGPGFSGIGGDGSPSDPFAVLLAAAQSAPATSSAGTGTAPSGSAAQAGSSPTAAGVSEATDQAEPLGGAVAAGGSAVAPAPAGVSAAAAAAAAAPAAASGQGSTAGALVTGAGQLPGSVPAGSAAGSPATSELAALGATTPLTGSSQLAATASAGAAGAAGAAGQPAAAAPAGATGADELGGVAPGTTLGATAAIDTASSSPGATAGGVEVVADATRYLGVPYVWGGTSPTTGFDCSGLVQHVFADLGVSLPRTSYEQFYSGTPVASLADAQPGDLLFFEPGQNGAGPGQPGHVAIYVGDGEMIAAPETGETVQVQPVPTAPMAIRRVEVPQTGSAIAGATAGPAAAGVAATAGSPSGGAVVATPAATPAGGVSGAASTTGAATGALDAAGAPAVLIGDVAVPAQYASLVETSAQASGVPASLLAAELQTESGFDADAVSSAGAEGIAQFMPATAAARGVDAFDPASAIPGAANYLADLESQLGSWPLAIAAYNAGPAAVSQSGGVPDNGQTPDDVATVLARAGMSGGTS